MRTQMSVEISGDAMLQLLELDATNAAVAERLLEKMWNGSAEAFRERARQSSIDPSAYHIRRRSVQFRVLLPPAEPVATVIGVELV